MKKITIMLLTLALAASMAACGQKADPTPAVESSTVAESSAVDSQAEATEDAPAEDDANEDAPADEDASTDADDAASKMLELDGYTMAELAPGMYTYTAADGSTIMMTTTPGSGAAMKDFFEKKDDAAKEALGQMAAALPEGVEASYDFATIEGKDTFFIKYDLEQGGVQVSSIAYMMVSGDDLITVAGAGMGKDLSADLAKVIAAL